MSKTENENVLPEGVGVRGFESHLPHQKRPAPHSISLLLAFLSPALAHRDSAKAIRNSFQNPLSIWAGFRACFRGWGHYRRVCDLSICAYSRSDKHEISCS